MRGLAGSWRNLARELGAAAFIHTNHNSLLGWRARVPRLPKQPCAERAVEAWQERPACDQWGPRCEVGGFWALSEAGTGEGSGGWEKG